MALVTVILNGSGGELDRIEVKTKGDNFTLADVLAALEERDGEGWMLGDGDTIRVVEEYRT